MSQFDNLRDKAEGYAKDHPDKVEEYSDKAGERAGDAADNATGNRYSEQVDKGQQKADDLVGRDGDEPSNADRAKSDQQ